MAEAVVVLTEDGADPERLAQLMGFLREEIADVDGARVRDVTEESVPEGARAVELAAAGAVVVAMARSETLRNVVAIVRQWLTRSQRPGRSITVRIGEDELVLTDATASSEAELVAMFVARHA